MELRKLRKLNENIKIKGLLDSKFKEYGRILVNYNFNQIIDYLVYKTEIPEKGNIYVASIEEVEKFNITKVIERAFYGEMPVQIGYCNGKNSTLNGLEYHKGSEINIAVTDFVLLLGNIKDIENNSYESSKIEAFYIPKGTAIEIYQTTLHFAPCKANKGGFKCIVILPKETNLPLDNKSVATAQAEEKLLFMKNKWLIVHPSRKALIEKGAYVGIVGENIEIKIN